VRKRWIIVAVVGVLGLLYFSGRMDHALYPLGLNFTTCARNGFGATFCGSELTAYEARFRGIQRQEQNLQRTITQEQCQADPSLSICAGTP